MNKLCLPLMYKDDAPLNTISKIRNEFQKLGIFIYETWKNIGEIYSVNLNIDGTTLTSNGKGESRELALASAYGEMAERLSFLLPFRVSPFYEFFYDNYNIKDKFNKIIPLEYGKWANSNYFDMYFDNMKENRKKNGEDVDDYGFRESYWKDVRVDNISYNYCMNFQKITYDKNSNFLIPLSVLDYYYGSNGMCAGNSKEEAIIQGISEIIERYVQKKVISGSIDGIFDVTEQILYQCNSIRNLQIKLKSKYKFKILECTNIFEIPVVAAILIRKDGAYYASFGCHPNLKIASSRAVDELCQGYYEDEIDDAMQKDCLSLNENEDANINYNNLLKFGQGKYPSLFIFGEYNKKDVKENCASGVATQNKMIFQEIIRRFDELGISVFCAEGLDLGVKTFHVIIPGISEVDTILPEKKIRSVRYSKLYSRMDRLDIKECNYLVEHCKQLYNSGEVTLEQQLGG